ncbi:MAG TPA: BBP7 family outer membrane beta-barrel protein [Urbifossiella sp.]|nr:BBP7 family outer membrane beta-barrel protein [Urbifossiella sp.]
MRHGILLIIACGLGISGELRAQESVPLPPPDPLPSGAPQPGNPPQVIIPPSTTPLPNYPSSPLPGTPGTMPGQSPVGPYGPYGPPPGMYPPGMYGPPPPGMYGPPVRLYRGDPASNPNLWFGIETLIWWSKAQPLSVPLITTGPASQGDNAGALGAPGTASLNQPLNFSASGGARLTFGGWLEPSHTWAAEGNFFVIGQQNTGFGANDHSQAGSFVINEPVVGAPFVTQVSAPGVETGQVDVHATTAFWGFEVNGMYNLLRNEAWTVNLLGGIRYLQLDEHLDITANSALFTNTVYTDNAGNTLATAPPGSTVTVLDQFGTRNEFVGGQAGLRFQYMMNRWSFNGTGTLALGNTHEVVTINGSTTVNPVNASSVFLQGGNFATLQTGTYSMNRFALAPALSLNVGYQFTPFLRGTIGYNIIGLSSVVRPGNQIDNTFDGMVHPLVPFTSSSFWAQGMTLGLQFSF